MLAKLKSRLRNRKVLLAVVSGILLILVNLGLIDVELSDKVLEAVNTLLGLGVSIGIFSNPDSHVQDE
ncbi:hypothetical protein MOD91_18100 [Bacillus haynesii]|uniref:hypothetical protein n=1 Tax=Bacillus haynesii TaxID=1925021 RepID=UPI002282A175|nr:hypothetical protein [Bacillus haynesii]MCY8048437.1 hypothetical protein [Bacillus haynesii]MCY8668775.1 hypothetical protein [Bacillus haynesii]MCY9324087.1 hypothetical protein [Bacillus haynesii]